MPDSVDNKHPDYAASIEDWLMMRHCSAGPIAVKGETAMYLPIPDGIAHTIEQDPTVGNRMYGAYLTRAQFPDILAPTVTGMVGVIHRKEAQIELPKSMEGIWERATKNGLTLEEFHQKITEELLKMGRYGVLVDADSQGRKELPWLAGYSAESIINWSPEQDFFVLDETGQERDGFDWKEHERYRVLRLEDGRYSQQRYDRKEEDGSLIEPRGRGGKPISQIPFVIAGARNLDTEVDAPPLAGVARSSLAMYRLDADYRHQLFMSGQETAFIIGIDKVEQLPRVLGAGVIHGLPPGADAKFVGVQGTGIAAHRTALMDERAAAVAAGARIFDSERREAESGEALRLRYSAQTASLTTIALASAKALERSLRSVAMFLGENPEKVIVSPNLEFVETTLSSQDVKGLVDSWMAGAFSYVTLYENLQRGGVASPERNYEEEQGLIAEETPDTPLLPTVPLEDDGEDISDEELAEMFDPALLEDAE